MIIESGRNTGLIGRKTESDSEYDLRNKVRIGWPKTGWILPKPRSICPVVQQMSEPCEFEFVPMKRAVRDSVAQIGNHTSKSEASIQSETALNAGETENSSRNLLETRHQREHKDV